MAGSPALIAGDPMKPRNIHVWSTALGAAMGTARTFDRQFTATLTAGGLTPSGDREVLSIAIQLDQNVQMPTVIHVSCVKAHTTILLGFHMPRKPTQESPVAGDSRAPADAVQAQRRPAPQLARH